MSKVVGLNGGPPPARLAGEPDQGLIDMLRDMLGMAERGELQSLVGVGFCADGTRASLWHPTHDNVYEMLGSINWLGHEYVSRVTGQAE